MSSQLKPLKTTGRRYSGLKAPLDGTMLTSHHIAIIFHNSRCKGKKTHHAFHETRRDKLLSASQSYTIQAAIALFLQILEYRSASTISTISKNHAQVFYSSARRKFRKCQSFNQRVNQWATESWRKSVTELTFPCSSSSSNTQGCAREQHIALCHIAYTSNRKILILTLDHILRGPYQLSARLSAYISDT